MRAAVDRLAHSGQLLSWGIVTTGVLVETLLDRGTERDVAEAEAAIERLAAAPADEGLVGREIWLQRLRALSGAGSRRCRCLHAVQGSLPRHGENAWPRRTYRVGRGVAVKMAGTQIGLRMLHRFRGGYTPVSRSFVREGNTMGRQEGSRWDVGTKDNVITLERFSEDDERVSEDVLEVQEARDLAALLTQTRGQDRVIRQGRLERRR